MRCLELYSGIGGFAVAARQHGWDVSLAIDISQPAAQVYRHNFQHPHRVRTIESVSADLLASAPADLWWMSPPCQPFTCRGNQFDSADPRTASFLAVLDHIRELKPPMLALENVPGFRSSLAANLLREVLSSVGYQWRETTLCPTELAIPNRRRRYYLVASRIHAPQLLKPNQRRFELSAVLDGSKSHDLRLSGAVASRYRGALHCVHEDDPTAVTACFTSAYGKSPIRSGSYLITDEGLRRFSPEEILRLLGFPRWFDLPSQLGTRTAWKLVGNSLSIPVVTHVLRSLGDHHPASAA